MEKILIEPEICDGCADCEDACKKLYGTSRIMVREIDNAYYGIVCQQCEDAPCGRICPTDAIINEEVVPEKCIGCGLCMLACPFGAVIMHDRKAQKCHQCPELEMPACIKACSKRAILLVDTDKMSLERQNKHLENMEMLTKKIRKKPPLVDIITTDSRVKSTLQ